MKSACYLLLVTTCLALLAACSGDAAREEAAKKAVLGAQFERVEVEFRNMRHYPGDITCGVYGSVDKWGKETSAQDFIVREGKADIRPGSDDLQVFCSAESAREVKTLLGIDWASPAVKQIHRDLKALDLALAEYVKDNFSVPTPRQGLGQLVNQGDAPPRPLKYREGGYLDSLPRDPWGREYRYKPSALGGVANIPEIMTLGADGAEGGTGDDTDISNRHLNYLDHLAAQ